MLVKMMNNSFGSKRGLFNSVKYKLLFWLGFYRKYQQIDFTQVKHLVFVCSGNICRSSLAEYVAKSKGLSSESYGLHCRGGDGADPRAIEFATSQGLDMSEHKTRNIKEYRTKNTDLIVAMEPSHLVELKQLGFGRSQMTTLPVWAINNIYLHDPFCSTYEFFKHCEEAVVVGVKVLKEKSTQAS